MLEELILSQLALKFSEYYGTPKVYYRIKNSSPLVSILSHIMPVYALQTDYHKIYFNIIFNLQIGLPSSIFPSGFLTAKRNNYFLKILSNVSIFNTLNCAEF